jgi:hypothetical protein
MLTLKALYSEMDLAKSGLIRKVLIKGRGAEVFSKFRPPHPVRALESVRALPCFFIGNLNIVAAMLCFAVKKTIAQDQNRSESTENGEIR